MKFDVFIVVFVKLCVWSDVCSFLFWVNFYLLVIVLKMRFGGVLVKVVMLLVLVVYVMDRVSVLESLLCILRVFGDVLFFEGELLLKYKKKLI